VGARHKSPDSTGQLAHLLAEAGEGRPRSWRRAASDDPARKPAVEAQLGRSAVTVVNLGRHLGRGRGDGAARLHRAPAEIIRAMDWP